MRPCMPPTSMCLAPASRSSVFSGHLPVLPRFHSPETLACNGRQPIVFNSNMRLLLAWLVLLLGVGNVAYAQRPSSLSICDYYAQNRYGGNNATTQFRLMQSIVALAFGGGRGVVGTDPDSTGILNPGNFEGQDVNLRSWFDGTSMALWRASSCLNRAC